LAIHQRPFGLAIEECDRVGASSTQSAIAHPDRQSQWAMRNQQSAISNQQSAIDNRNRQSSIENRQSPIDNP
jgi:hypothetical protein